MFNLRKTFSAIVAFTAVALLASPVPVSALTVREAQWFLDTVNAPAAQKISKGEGVTVCVVDSGVDATHPDLAGAVLPGKSFGQSPDPEAKIDNEGHGTAMAGLIAARGGGANNALGIAPAAKILPVSPPAGIHAQFGDAIKYCVDNGAKVINFSVGRVGEIGQADKDAMAYAVNHDVVVAVAMANKGQENEPNSFSKLPGIIAVAGTTQSNEGWIDSWTGPQVALSAPAITVTTHPKAQFSSGFGNGNGTSDSTAIVSGVAALVRAKYPNLDAANVINRLIKSATDLGTPGRDEVFGFGLVNAEKALTMDVAAVTANPLGTPEQAANNTDTGPVANNIFNVQSNASPLAWVGPVVLFLIIAGVVVFVIKRRKRSNAAPPQAYNPQAQVGTGYVPVQPAAPPMPQQPYQPPSPSPQQTYQAPPYNPVPPQPPAQPANPYQQPAQQPQTQVGSDQQQPPFQTGSS